MKRLVMSKAACLAVVFVITLLVCLISMNSRSDTQQTAIAGSAIAVSAVIAVCIANILSGCKSKVAIIALVGDIVGGILAAIYGGIVMAGAAVEKPIASVIVVVIAVATAATAVVVGPIGSKKTIAVTCFVVAATTALILDGLPRLM